MKKLLVGITLIASTGLMAQITAPQPSPAAKVQQTVGLTDISIEYSRPSKNDRVIFGELVPMDEVWRTGANDATTIEFTSDVKIEGQSLPKGKYALFTIPEENEWTIIINKNAKQWGAYSYKQEEDVLRVKVKSQKSAAFNESLKFEVANDMVHISWENLMVMFSVK